MLKRTKIIATIGPSTKSKNSILKLYKKGMNVVRINMSHASHQELEEIINNVRLINKSLTCAIGIMVDTQGPEIRTAKNSEVLELVKGEQIILSSKKTKDIKKSLQIDNLKYVKGIKKNGRISLDNGSIDLKITRASKEKIYCDVLDNGQISGRKHVNFPGATISLPTITDKDKRDLKFAASLGVDFVALSFCRTKNDINDLKKTLKSFKKEIELFVKVEDQQGLSNLEDIVSSSDGIMVARGDLGIETDITNLPYTQRKMIKVAAKHGKKSIVATQLLESMIHNPHPTRAEVSDVANAVYEGADALMLSAETGIGQHPYACVAYLKDIAINAERSETLLFPSLTKQKTDWHILASTSVKLAEKINADAILVLTRSGFTANLISLAKPKLPVFAVTNDSDTHSRLSICSSVQNIHLRFQKNHEKTIESAFSEIKKNFNFKKNSKFVVISGVFSDIYADAIQVRFLN